MNGLGTIEHDFVSKQYDGYIERSKQQRRKNPYSVSPCYRNKTFCINPKWSKAFTGREEYT